jgi:hypothetical protein
MCKHHWVCENSLYSCSQGTALSLPSHLVAVVGLWSGRGSDVRGHAWILAQLIESDFAFEMSYDRNTPMTVFGTMFTVEILS